MATTDPGRISSVVIKIWKSYGERQRGNAAVELIRGLMGLGILFAGGKFVFDFAYDKSLEDGQFDLTEFLGFFVMPAWLLLIIANAIIGSRDEN